MKRHNWFLVLFMVFLLGTTARAQQTPQPRGGGPADPVAGVDILNLLKVLPASQQPAEPRGGGPAEPLAGDNILDLLNRLQASQQPAGPRVGGVRGSPPVSPDLVNEVRLIIAPVDRPQAGGAWWTNTALVTRLGLTEDQKLKIERAYESHRQNLLSSKETLEKEEAQLAKILGAEPLDRTAGIAQIYKVVQARGEMEKTNGLMTFEMREVLTRAQWMQLQAQQTPGISLNTLMNQVPGGVGLNESRAVSNLRTINTAQVVYLSSTRGSFGTLSSLIAAGLLHSGFTGTMDGYNFSVTTTGRDYTATALPASPQTGRYGFYSTPDAVVRYSTDPSLSPPGQGGNPVR